MPAGRRDVSVDVLIYEPRTIAVTALGLEQPAVMAYAPTVIQTVTYKQKQKIIWRHRLTSIKEVPCEETLL